MRSLAPLLVGCLLAHTGFSHPEDGATTPAPRDDTAASAPVTTGNGVHTFQTVPNWGTIPEQLKIGPTHGGIVIDKAGLIYVSSDSEKGIFVFNADGTLVRTIAGAYPGIHGMTLREENGVEFLYAAHLLGAQALKLTLLGEPVLTIPYPAEAGVYPDGQGYKPTAIAVAPNGDIFVADGYGLSLIHKFDATGKYLKTFGSKGKEPGQFRTCHGLAIDTRSGAPLLLVCDRENRRLQYFDLDGNFVRVLTTGLRRPCTASIRGEFVAIAELEGRVTILDHTNQPVAFLGDNPDKAQWAKYEIAPEWWKAGLFIAPHSVCYDPAGNLYVQDWNKTGRLTKLLKSTP